MPNKKQKQNKQKIVIKMKFKLKKKGWPSLDSNLGQWHGKDLPYPPDHTRAGLET